MFVWPVLTFLDQMEERKKKEEDERQLASTGLSKKTPARVRDIARARQTRNTTRDLRGPRRTSDVLLDTAVFPTFMSCQQKLGHPVLAIGTEDDLV